MPEENVQTPVEETKEQPTIQESIIQEFLDEVQKPVEEAPKKKRTKKVEEPAVEEAIKKIEETEEEHDEELDRVEKGEVKCNVVEVEAPAIEPVEQRPHATINGKDYFIDSDNSDLLEDVAGGKEKNPTTGQWEDKMFKYLPAKHIYTLMDALFDTYDFKSEPMKYTGEEYVVNKKKYNAQTKKWEEVEETMRVYEKTVRIVTTVKVDEYQTIVRETVGYAQGVAGLGILTNDSARNGFANKLAFRARKEALKNLGKVFRTYEYGEDENEFIPEETTAVAGKALADVAAAIDPIENSEGAEWNSKIVEKLKTIKDFFADNAQYTEDEMTKAMFAVKADLGIDASKKVAMDEFKKIYNTLKSKVAK